MDVSGYETPRFGRLLLVKILSSHSSPIVTPQNDTHIQLEDVCAATLAILLEELHCCLDLERLPQLEASVAAYISLSRVNGWHGRALSISHFLELNYVAFRLYEARCAHVKNMQTASCPRLLSYIGTCVRLFNKYGVFLGGRGMSRTPLNFTAA